MQGTSEYPCKLMFPLHCHLYVQNFKETTREHTVWDGFIQTVNTQDMCVYNPTVRMTKMDQCVKRQTVFIRILNHQPEEQPKTLEVQNSYADKNI